MQAETTRVRSFDGTEIAVYTWGADTARVPVLLHHGYGVSAQQNWVAPGLAAALVEAGRRVIAVDARGHGASGKPRGAEHYGEANMARDLAAVAAALGLDAFDLVGYSMGAVVSLIAATQQPQIRRLAVGGVGAGIVELGGVDRRVLPPSQLIESFETEDPAQIRHPGAAAFRRLVDSMGGDRQALADQARAVNTTPIPLDRITAPTLLFAGTSDPLAQRPELLQQAIAGAALLRVEGDHFTALRQPELAPRLVAFLA